MKNQVKVMLPTALIEAINQLGLSRIMTRKCYKLCDRILYKQFVKKEGDNGFLPLSSEYLQKAFDKSYHKFFKPMNEHGILQSNGFYSIGIAKQYRINPKYINEEFSEVVYKEKQGEPDEYNEINDTKIFVNSHCNLSPGASCKNHSQNSSILSSQSTLSSSSLFSLSSSHPTHSFPLVFEKQLIYDDLDGLEYNYDLFLKTIEEEVAYIIPRNFKINDRVERNGFKVVNRQTGKTYRTSKVKALKSSKEHGCDLIKDNRKYYIDKLDDFIKQKRWFKIRNYLWQISKLENKHYYAKRNCTNHRLDHNLSTIPKALLKVIIENNDLIEIDIRNSQFAFHAYWMKDVGWLQYEDVCTFYDLAVKGKLYEELAGIFNVTRDKAKELMMELAFSSHKYSSTLKKQFRGVFPNVLRHIEEYKSNAESSKLFSIELQKRESELIIDHIYPRIKSEGIFCLTRHDSLLVRRDEFDVALRILKECCIEREFECTVKADGESVIIGESQMDNEENTLAWLDEHEARQNELRKEKEFYKQLYPNKLI